MKASELMIRNVVFDPDRSEQDFEGLGKGIYRVSAHAIERFDAGWMKLEPVELTEEWLIKFGFVKGPFNYVHRSGHDRRRQFAIDTDKNGFVFIVKDVKKIPVIHVHHLQNLFFAITGSELELTK